MSFKRVAFRALLFAGLAGFACSAYGQDLLILIVGPGSNAEFRPQGVSEAVVNVGQTIRWQSSNTNRDHTATAFANDSSVIFDTGSIGPNGSHRDVLMTQDIFRLAGGQPGAEVLVNYECDFHSGMRGSFVLRDSRPNQAARRVERRNILHLSSDELTQYRDAWREIQANGEFARVAGYHGCPRFFCHTDSSIFLPWHREYVLRLEAALRAANPDVALHYWDWAGSTASNEGIPAAFTAATYTSGGSVHPNPLRSFAFRCPPTSALTTTSRRPGPGFQLGGFATMVRRSYLETQFARFTSRLEQPHGSLHVWVGGQMGGTTYAAYDPLFWAHHSNVDRQWASWQAAGGSEPPADVMNRELPGFTGRRTEHVVEFSALGYSYDRLDDVQPITEFTEAGVRTPDEFRKSFAVELPERVLAEAAMENDSQLSIRASGIPDHPSESFMVHVFFNSPDPSLEDVSPENPHYLGSFGIFGGERGAESHDARETATVPSEREVLIAPAPAIQEMSAALGADPQNSITIIATNPEGELVPIDRVPVEVFQIGLLEDAVDAPVMRSVLGDPSSKDASGNIEAANEMFMAAMEEEHDGPGKFDADRPARVASKTAFAKALSDSTSGSKTVFLLEAEAGEVNEPVSDESIDFLNLPAVASFFYDPPESLCEPDERVQVLDTVRAPFNANCQLIITLNNGRKAVGTGWFYGPQCIVTAGHCVHEGDAGQFFRSVEVVPAMNGLRRPYGSAIGTRLRASAGWQSSGTQADDYGAILLDQPFPGVPNNPITILRSRVLTDEEFTGRELRISGYPADKENGTQWQCSGPLSTLQPNRLRYMIDTFGGHSGSPVTISDTEGLWVVGIHNYGGCPNKSTRITRQVKDDLDAWLAESQSLAGGNESENNKN